MGRRSRERKAKLDRPEASEPKPASRNDRLWGTGVVFTVLMVIAAFVAIIVPLLKRDPAPELHVFLAACEPNSDFELGRGGRTVLFVQIPKLDSAPNRLVFGTLIIRPVNVGDRSVDGLSLTTIFGPKLWHPSLGQLDQASLLPLGDSKLGDVDVQPLDDRWVVTRQIPRLDPMTGAPFPVSFLLQIAGPADNGSMTWNTAAEMEIRAHGRDWEGVQQTVDIRCIPSDSSEHFVAAVETSCRALRAMGYPDVPVVMAATGGSAVVSSGDGPLIAQAKVAMLFERGGATLYDF